MTGSHTNNKNKQGLLNISINYIKSLSEIIRKRFMRRSLSLLIRALGLCCGAILTSHYSFAAVNSVDDEQRPKIAVVLAGGGQKGRHILVC